ncbi:MAG: RnfABCDGE type electron transport complex subunit D [Firmicutes bacterium]|nr:RnfABCDGE type electron transport complex subunit D [Bacillota bacterium]MDH7494967.1 RnfABCDGE type electron transport complex subunit D [Bacillota bacterium]
MDATGLVVSSSPHQRTAVSTPVIMSDVILALMPASLAGVWFFGLRAFAMMLVCVVAAVATEAGLEKLFRKPITIGDYSAAVAGLLLALVLPPDLPLWIGAIGAVFSMAIAKFIFGGLGQNVFNPALIGRAVLLASWPVAMTRWRWPLFEAAWISDFDALSSATPLALLRLGGIKTPYVNLFLGNVAGSIGETSALAILIGAAYLIWRGHINWRIPASFIGTVAVLAALFGEDPLFHMLAGGLFLGAFFMATDYVTSPVTPKGQIAFGIGCGVLTVLIRLFGGYPEGVCYAILIMNSATALIDRVTVPRKFGEVKKGA